MSLDHATEEEKNIPQRKKKRGKFVLIMTRNYLYESLVVKKPPSDILLAGIRLLARVVHLLHLQLLSYSAMPASVLELNVQRARRVFYCRSLFVKYFG